MNENGILLSAHGTVESLDDLPEFLARIRNGRPPPPGLVDELKRRYSAIGGSPLLAVTRAQAAALAKATDLPVFVGMRLFRPELVDALGEAVRAGVRRLCVLPLAPFSVPVYFRAAAKACESLGGALELVAAEPFGEHPEFVAAEAALLAPRLFGGDEEQLVLTAHSLPLSVVNQGDPYPQLVERSAQAIGAQLGQPFVLAYQSQGEGGGEWLGPDLKSVLLDAKNRGKRRVVIGPVGFLSDHVETLYDLDIEARAWAGELDLEFERVPALNAAPGLIATLRAVARRALFG